MFDTIFNFIREIYQTEDFIPLHEPRFNGNEKKYLIDTIDSGFVSSVGQYVIEFEKRFAEYVGSKHAVAVSNGTSALHAALVTAEVVAETEVITQPLTFIATCNAISYVGATPIFCDIDRKTLGLCPNSLDQWLEKNTVLKNGICINRNTGKTITACIPMHTFGFSCHIDQIVQICDRYNIVVIEDAAESLGTSFNDKHTGTFGTMGVFSFNGNKIITTGGGGMIVTDDAKLAAKAKHLTTTAKVSHAWEYFHDSIGYNYRMPNINAALGCAQIEQMPEFLRAKRNLAASYRDFFSKTKITFLTASTGTESNCWLNAILLDSIVERDLFLKLSNEQGIMTRPAWELMHKLPMFKKCETAPLSNAEWIAERLVNIPSSVPKKIQGA